MKVEYNGNINTEVGRQIEGGDVVYMVGSGGTSSFWGIYVPNIGIVGLEHGSTAYCSTKSPAYLGSIINYWTVSKVFRNAKLVINDA